MRAATELTLTMRPQRVRAIGMTSGWVTWKNPCSDTSITRCHCAGRMPGNAAAVVPHGNAFEPLPAMPEALAGSVVVWASAGAASRQRGRRVAKRMMQWRREPSC